MQAPQVLHVDERLVSGEGRGICKLAGQRVIGGSRNASHADAFIQVQVVRLQFKSAKQTTLTQGLNKHSSSTANEGPLHLNRALRGSCGVSK